MATTSTPSVSILRNHEIHRLLPGAVPVTLEALVICSFFPSGEDVGVFWKSSEMPREVLELHRQRTALPCMDFTHKLVSATP